MEYFAFEQRVLRLIFRTNVILTPVHVAYHLRVPVAEARIHLDSMLAAGILELDSDDDGHLVYRYPLRPPLSSLPDPPPPKRRRKRPRRETALMPLPRVDPPALRPERGPDGLVLDDADSSYSPAAAAALSFFLPGVGQIYSGRIPQGIGWMLATGLGYLLFLVPGLILHICCVVNAAAVPKRVPLFGETA